MSSLIQHYHNAELNADNNNYDTEKSKLLSSSKEIPNCTSNLELPSVGFDFLKFMHNGKSSIANNLSNENGKDFAYLFDSLSSSQQSQPNVVHNNNTPPLALLNAISFLKPNDNVLKSATGRRSNGSSSSISISPPPPPAVNINNTKININKEHTLPNAAAVAPMLDLSFAMSLFQQANSLFNNNNINNKNNNNNNKV